jgi:hypothetical protein
MEKKETSKTLISKEVLDHIDERVGTAMNSHTSSWYENFTELKEDIEKISQKIRGVTIKNILILTLYYAVYDLLIKPLIEKL